MTTIIGAVYEKKREKIADAYAHIVSASEKLSNLLAYLDPAILPEDELFIAELCNHIDKAKDALENF